MATVLAAIIAYILGSIPLLLYWLTSNYDTSGAGYAVTLGVQMLIYLWITYRVLEEACK